MFIKNILINGQKNIPYEFHTGYKIIFCQYSVVLFFPVLALVAFFTVTVTVTVTVSVLFTVD